MTIPNHSGVNADEPRLATLKSEYGSSYPVYQTLCTAMVEQIEELLRAAELKLASRLEWRVKTWDSVTEKVKTKWTEAKSLDDIRDLAGIRIVALFRRDVQPIQELIEKHFVILHKEDASQRLGENQFGYGSVHYEVTALDGWTEVPTLRKLKGLRAEIQLRTGSQHIWAAASHALQYKKEDHVPPPVRRSINRVAALLETVDLEFERVLEEREEYSHSIQGEPDSLPLNVESMRRVLDRLLPSNNREPFEPYADLLDDLRTFKIDQTSKLENLIRKRLDRALVEDRSSVNKYAEMVKVGKDPVGTSKERIEAGVFFAHVGLIRVMLEQEDTSLFHTMMRRRFEAKKSTVEKHDRRQE